MFRILIFLLKCGYLFIFFVLLENNLLYLKYPQPPVQSIWSCDIMLRNNNTLLGRTLMSQWLHYQSQVTETLPAGSLHSVLGVVSAPQLGAEEHLLSWINAGNYILWFVFVLCVRIQYFVLSVQCTLPFYKVVCESPLRHPLSTANILVNFFARLIFNTIFEILMQKKIKFGTLKKITWKWSN